MCTYDKELVFDRKSSEEIGAADRWAFGPIVMEFVQRCNPLGNPWSPERPASWFQIIFFGMHSNQIPLSYLYISMPKERRASMTTTWSQ